MDRSTHLRIAIACYPSVGGSGILATALGVELARLGHQVHFVTYESPVRLPHDEPGILFHPVPMQGFGIFKHDDYTLPLAVTLAEVAREHGLDVIHAHYAVPHATAAALACDFLPPELRPRVVTTLHGTDTMLLGRDPGYMPVIRHALGRSDAVTTVSAFLRRDTLRLVDGDRPIEVIPNFFTPRAPSRSREAARAELGIRDDEALILHVSTLRPVKRIDLLLESVSRVRSRRPFKLLIVAGDDFTPFRPELERLGLAGRTIVREKVNAIDDYIVAADLGLITSEYESFCLSILEAMTFGVPSVATAVGGIPEVIEDGVSGVLVPFGDPESLARAVDGLLDDPERRHRLALAGVARAREHFSARRIVPMYLDLYRRVCAQEARRA